MTYRVVIHQEAACEIREAARRIQEQSGSATTALQWVQGIEVAIDTLRTQPLPCLVNPDSSAYGEEVRLLLQGKRRGLIESSAPSSGTRFGSSPSGIVPAGASSRSNKRTTSAAPIVGHRH
jgi:hypothetical protein